MNVLRRTVVLLAGVLAGCGTEEPKSPQTEVRMKEFTSEAGNSIVCPEDWTSEDHGDTWGLHGPDGQVRFVIMTFTVDGTGSLDDFAQIMSANIEQKGSFKKSGPETVDFDGVAATKYRFDPKDSSTASAWRLYLLQRGKYYHAVMIEAMSDVMPLNEGAYEEFVRSFKGIE